MRPWTIRAALVGAVVATSISCAGDGPTAPDRVALAPTFQPLVVGTGPAVRISEIHYDNSGTDTGEAVEVSGPAGTSLTGWSLVFYNGNAPAAATTYRTTPLTGTIPTTCNERGVVVVTLPQDGIQNGPNDGVALVNASGTVIELLSYEGPFTASNGPAAGMTSTDIGVSEVSTTTVGHSLQRQPNGTWTGPVANTFLACNDGDENGGGPVAVASVVVTPATATVAVGATVNLTATALDAANAPVVGASLTWSSDAEGVASVTSSGVVSGLAVGTARIIATATDGAADTAVVTVEAPTVSLPPVRFSEIHYDNFDADVNEGIEIEGPAGTDVTGWSIVLYNGNGGVTYEPTRVLSGTIPAQCDGRGTLFVTYPSNGIQNGSPDGFALVDAGGAVVEFLSYEGTFAATNGPAAGLTSVDIGAQQASAPVGTSLQRNAAGAWSSQPTNFGYCFGVTPPPPPNAVTFSGRDGGDPALPVGFEAQVFATLRSGVDNSVITTTFTWTSETPLLASVDANGVVRALGAGTMILRATAADGTTGTYALQSTVAAPSGTASYLGNTEFGDPTDGDASDEIIIRRDQYTSSFSAARGIPNWVSYNLEATHFGGSDRCNCFTYDPELPQAQKYTTADYTGAGAAANYGIDRGHLVRSFDRTSGSFDNATTFYFSNIIPQAADNNQGPWAQFENFLGDLARFNDREVYIIAGASGSKGTVKGEGKITIPSATWKVAVILPRNGGLASVQSWQDLEVRAVIMPNDPGIRNVAWQTYETTVDAVEALSGFDLLTALRDDIEIAVESNTVPPTAALDGPWAGWDGDAIAMSAANSGDADGDALTYSWDFGDGTRADGESVTHRFDDPGDYVVRLIVTDARGLADTVTSTATVTLLPPLEGVARARAGIASLRDSGRLPSGQATAFLARLDATQRALEGGQVRAAKALLPVLVDDLKKLNRAGILTRPETDPIREILMRTMRALET